jgi:hypothetical protein
MLYVNGEPVGATLENVATQIPAGEYGGRLRQNSPSGLAQGPFGSQGDTGDFLIEITGVGGRTDLLFHGGNKPKQSRGCVLLGGVIHTSKGGVVPDEIPLRRLRLMFYGTDVPDATPAVSIKVSIRDAAAADEVPPNLGSPRCAQIEADGYARKRELEKAAIEQDEAAAALRRNGAYFQPIDDQIAKVVEELHGLPAKAEGELGPLAAKVASLVAERDKALEELRTGHFCSKCRRPASEIERAEHVSFAAHLGIVHGEAIPVTQKELDAKAAEYDRTIDAAVQEFNRAYARFAQRDKDLRNSYQDLIAQRHATWAAFRTKVVGLERRADESWGNAKQVSRQTRDAVDACRRGRRVP